MEKFKKTCWKIFKFLIDYDVIYFLVIVAFAGVVYDELNITEISRDTLCLLLGVAYLFHLGNVCDHNYLIHKLDEIENKLEEKDDKKDKKTKTIK